MLVLLRGITLYSWYGNNIMPPCYLTSYLSQQASQGILFFVIHSVWCFFYLCCVQDYQLVVLEYKTKYSDNIHAWYGTVGLHYHAHTHLFFSFLYISKIPRTFFLCSRVLRFKVLRTSTYQVHYNMAYHVCADLLGSLRRMYQHMFFLTLK